MNINTPHFNTIVSQFLTEAKNKKAKKIEKKDVKKYGSKKTVSKSK